MWNRPPPSPEERFTILPCSIVRSSTGTPPHRPILKIKDGGHHFLAGRAGTVPLTQNFARHPPTQADGQGTNIFCGRSVHGRPRVFFPCPEFLQQFYTWNQDWINNFKNLFSPLLLLIFTQLLPVAKFLNWWFKLYTDFQPRFPQKISHHWSLTIKMSPLPILLLFSWMLEIYPHKSLKPLPCNLWVNCWWHHPCPMKRAPNFSTSSIHAGSQISVNLMAVSSSSHPKGWFLLDLHWDPSFRKYLFVDKL